MYVNYVGMGSFPPALAGPQGDSLVAPSSSSSFSGIFLTRDTLSNALVCAASAVTSVTCSCTSPNQGTSGSNRYTCTDSSWSAYCASTEACFSTGWTKGASSSSYCKVPATGTLAETSPTVAAAVTTVTWCR
jgi:hypothetical protein